MDNMAIDSRFGNTRAWSVDPMLCLYDVDDDCIKNVRSFVGCFFFHSFFFSFFLDFVDIKSPLL